MKFKDTNQLSISLKARIYKNKTFSYIIIYNVLKSNANKNRLSMITNALQEKFT